VLATGAFDRTLRLWELASGKERYQFKGHEGGPDALAFGPGSRTLAMACTDAPVYIWDVTGQALNPKTTLSANELDLLWPDLAADAATAFQTMRKLVVAPDSTVSFLKNRLKAPVTIPRGKLSQLLKDLDDDKFAVRDKANRELEELGERAETALRSALENNPSLELRRRVELLLEKLKDRPSDELRTIRCLELLEWISTAEATGVVETVAKGGPDSRISRDAVRSVQRMRK
jgi:hypothetical protein